MSPLQTAQKIWVSRLLRVPWSLHSSTPATDLQKSVPEEQMEGGHYENILQVYIPHSSLMTLLKVADRRQKILRTSIWVSDRLYCVYKTQPRDVNNSNSKIAFKPNFHVSIASASTTLTMAKKRWSKSWHLLLYAKPLVSEMTPPITHISVETLSHFS